MNRLTPFILITTAMIAAGCSDSADDRTVGQKVDATLDKSAKAALDAKEAAGEKLAAAEVALKQAGKDVESRGKQLTEDTRKVGERLSEAASDRKDQLARNITDTAITASVNAGLAKDPDLSAFRIDVDTRDGVVAMYGPAPSEAARERASQIARSVKGVVGVQNRLTIKVMS